MDDVERFFLMKQSLYCPSDTVEETLDTVPVTSAQYKEVLRIQQHIIKMMAQRKSHHIIFNTLCTMAETLLENAVATIMLKDKETGLLNLKYAPSIDKKDWYALESLKPGPHGGSCGNALYHNQPQYVVNTFEDARWRDLKNVAEAFHLCSCWSMPIRDADGNAIGSFALSSFEHRAPTIFHKVLLETSANIVSIVLMHLSDAYRVTLLNSTIEHMSEGIIFTDHHNRIIEVNPAFEKIYGYTANEVSGKDPSILSSGTHNKDFYKQMWERLVATGHWSGEIVNKNKAGGLVTQWMSINRIYTEDGEENYAAICTDISPMKKAQEQIAHLAYYDPLTGVYNKTKLMEVLDEVTSSVALVAVDVNNLHTINMAYGFAMGDSVLKAVAALLKSEFGANALFRIDSDEFILLYESEEAAISDVKQIKRYFYKNPLAKEDVTLNLTFNYGIASGENVFKNAIHALHISKRDGKNRCHRFSPETDLLSKEKKQHFIRINHLLHRALAGDGIVPYLQFIHNNTTDSLDRCEMLARIETEEGVLLPEVFLEAAKLSGLLPEITRRMIKKSFACMEHQATPFSINVTEDDLNGDYLAAYLDEQNRRYNIAPERVTLEILEGISASAKLNHIEQLKKLRAQGYHLAIDDFGAEYSNFERLLDLEIDMIKIDAKYIREIDTDTKSREIVKAITSFAHNLGIQCTAEYVHNKKIQKIVEQMGIDFSQGYLFHHPEKHN